MDKRILYLFTRTPLHVGAGKDVGIVDAPIMRERHTRIPIIPGSSLKGVMRALSCDDKITTWLFGSEDAKNASAGALLIGEARVLAFPIRSAKGAFAWITCPLALNRYKRDTDANFTVPEVLAEKCHAAVNLIFQDGTPRVIFEDYVLDARPLDNDALLAALQATIEDDVWSELKNKLAIVSDEVFSHFVDTACEVVYRIRINDDTGTVDGGGLFNQENVPSETLFYTVVAAQRGKGEAHREKSAEDALKELTLHLQEAGNLLQIGGDETIGLGYCSVTIAPTGGAQ